MVIDVLAPDKLIRLPHGSEISCVKVFEELLFCGLKNGVLCCFLQGRMKPSISSTSRNLDERPDKELIIKKLRSQNFSLEENKTPIFTLSNITEDGSQICGIECAAFHDETKLIFAIGRQTICTFEVEEKESKNMNVTKLDKAITVHQVCVFDGNIYIVVGLKKVLMLFKVVKEGRHNRLQKVVEYTLKEKALAICKIVGSSTIIVIQMNHIAIINTKNHYQMNNISIEDSNVLSFSHSSLRYFGISNSLFMKAIEIPYREEVFLVFETSVIEISFKTEGISSKTTNIKFTSVPVDVGYIDNNYIWAAFNKRMDIIEIETGDTIQSYNHKVNSSGINCTSNRDNVFIGSDSIVLSFKIATYEAQIEQYLRKIEPNATSEETSKDEKLMMISKVISLVSNISGDNPIFNDQPNRRKAKYLYLRRLYLKKCQLLFNYFSKYHESIVDIGTNWILSIHDILPLFPDFLNGESQIKGEPLAYEGGGNSLSLLTLADIDAISSSQQSDSGSEVESSDRQLQKVIPKQSSINFKRLNKAVSNLVIYLTDQRRINNLLISDDSSKVSIQWKNVSLNASDLYSDMNYKIYLSQIEEKICIIDTTLFLCYYYFKPMMMGPLLRLPTGKCDPKVIRMSFMNQSNGQPNQKYLKELLDFYYCQNLHNDALNMLRNLADVAKKEQNTELFNRCISLSIQYLRNLTNKNMNIIVEFAFWIFEENKNFISKYSRLLFMNDSYQCESYDPEVVLDLLLKKLKNPFLAQEYLEWYMSESESFQNLKLPVKQLLSTLLAEFYIQSLGDYCSDQKDIRNHPIYTKLSALLRSNTLYDAPKLLKTLEIKGKQYLRLVIFIYRRLDEHQKSIETFLSKLNDLDGAMDYCSEIFKSKGGEGLGRNLLHSLLDLILEDKKNADAAVERLLIMQGSKMNIELVLHQLPSSFELFRISQFLMGKIRSNREQAYDSQILVKVEDSKYSKSLQKLSEEETCYFIINGSEQVCRVCKKRLGYGIFSGINKKEVVHYSCYSGT